MTKGELSLNPALDLDSATSRYRAEGVVRIDKALTDESAAALVGLLARELPWRVLMTEPDGRPVHFSQDDWRAMSAAQREARLQDVQARGARNEGFFYLAYPMIEAYLKGWDAGHPIHAVTEFLNAPAFREVGRRIAGLDEVTKCEAQAACYGRGHFLTRHIDIGEASERRAAFVLGLTQGWNPDWGGLLLFLNENQDVDRGFLPSFNTLTVFDTRLVHTVSQVATFAAGSRLTVSGWFRDDPPAGQAH